MLRDLAKRRGGARRGQGAHYVERSTTKAGEVLELAEPVRATIRPEDLLD
ncbi:hypothetical protein [Micromonospora sp. NBC_00860]|nr:hypothetical protein OH804_32605 [Micromonospora sp. NBC_00860]WTA66965.1 hypothetical protein OHB51_31730 [Micromonospora sp. NBC_00855]